MLIQNNTLQKNSSLLQQQLAASSKAQQNNPYAKTGRILSSLGQKQSAQSLGHGSTGAVKGGRSTKINTKTVASSNPNLKGTMVQSVSSSSSVGSSKMSHGSAGQFQSHKTDSHNIYLKTLTRA